MSEEEIKERIKYFKHYVVDNLSLDAQDDFQKILDCITNLQEELTKYKKLVNKIYACISNNQIFLNEDEGNILDERTIEYILKLIEEIDED